MAMPARLVYGIVVDPDDETRVCIGHLKGNYGRPGNDFAYRVESRELADGISAPVCEWETTQLERGTVKKFFSLGNRAGDGEQRKIDEAKEFLQKALGEGAVLEDERHLLKGAAMKAIPSTNWARVSAWRRVPN